MQTTYAWRHESKLKIHKLMTTYAPITDVNKFTALASAANKIFVLFSNDSMHQFRLCHGWPPQRGLTSARDMFRTPQNQFVCTCRPSAPSDDASMTFQQQHGKPSWAFHKLFEVYTDVRITTAHQLMAWQDRHCGTDAVQCRRNHVGK